MQYMDEVWTDGEVLVRVHLSDLETIEAALFAMAHARPWSGSEVGIASEHLGPLVQQVIDEAREDLES